MSGNKPASGKSNIERDQKLSAFGLLAAVAGAFFLRDLIPLQHIISASIGFGTGTSISVAFYRVAGLLKNGKAEKNQFGQGTLAGVALLAGLLSFTAIPGAVRLVQEISKDSGALPWMIIIGGGIAGFMQNRTNTLMSIMEDGADDNKRE